MKSKRIMVANSYCSGDLVWAKMKGYPFWPGKVVDPPTDGKNLPKQTKNKHYIFFFGSENHAWITDDNIKPHSEKMLPDNIKKKSAQFQAAVDIIMNEGKKPIKKEKPDGKVKEKHTSEKPVSEKKTARVSSIAEKSDQSSSSTRCPGSEKLKTKPLKKRPQKRSYSDVEIDVETVDTYKKEKVEDEDDPYKALLEMCPTEYHNGEASCSSQSQPSTSAAGTSLKKRSESPSLDLENILGKSSSDLCSEKMRLNFQRRCDYKWRKLDLEDPQENVALDLSLHPSSPLNYSLDKEQTQNSNIISQNPELNRMFPYQLHPTEVCNTSQQSINPNNFPYEIIGNEPIQNSIETAKEIDATDETNPKQNFLCPGAAKNSFPNIKLRGGGGSNTDIKIIKEIDNSEADCKVLFEISLKDLLKQNMIEKDPRYKCNLEVSTNFEDSNPSACAGGLDPGRHSGQNNTSDKSERAGDDSESIYLFWSPISGAESPEGSPGLESLPGCWDSESDASDEPSSPDRSKFLPFDSLSEGCPVPVLVLGTSDDEVEHKEAGPVVSTNETQALAVGSEEWFQSSELKNATGRECYSSTDNVEH